MPSTVVEDVKRDRLYLQNYQLASTLLSDVISLHFLFLEGLPPRLSSRST